MIHAKRLSAKDASLTSLTITTGKLDPEFSSNHFDYTCTLVHCFIIVSKKSRNISFCHIILHIRSTHFTFLNFYKMASLYVRYRFRHGWRGLLEII